MSMRPRTYAYTQETVAMLSAAMGESGTASSAASTIVIGAISLIGTCLVMWFLAGGRFGGPK